MPASWHEILWDIEPKGVSYPVDDVEQCADRNGVSNGLVAQPRHSHRREIFLAELVRHWADSNAVQDSPDKFLIACAGFGPKRMRRGQPYGDSWGRSCWSRTPEGVKAQLKGNVRGLLSFDEQAPVFLPYGSGGRI